jgi:GTP-binding protein Era
MTFALGYAVKYAYENNIELNKDTFQDLYEIFLKKEAKEDSEKKDDEKK